VTLRDANPLMTLPLPPPPFLLQGGGGQGAARRPFSAAMLGSFDHSITDERTIRFMQGGFDKRIRELIETAHTAVKAKAAEGSFSNKAKGWAMKGLSQLVFTSIFLGTIVGIKTTTASLKAERISTQDASIRMTLIKTVGAQVEGQLTELTSGHDGYNLLVKGYARMWWLNQFNVFTVFMQMFKLHSTVKLAQASTKVIEADLKKNDPVKPAGLGTEVSEADLAAEEAAAGIGELTGGLSSMSEAVAPSEPTICAQVESIYAANIELDNCKPFDFSNPPKRWAIPADYSFKNPPGPIFRADSVHNISRGFDSKVYKGEVFDLTNTSALPFMCSGVRMKPFIRQEPVIISKRFVTVPAVTCQGWPNGTQKDPSCKSVLAKWEYRSVQNGTRPIIDMTVSKTCSPKRATKGNRCIETMLANLVMMIMINDVIAYAILNTGLYVMNVKVMKKSPHFTPRVTGQMCIRSNYMQSLSWVSSTLSPAAPILGFACICGQLTITSTFFKFTYLPPLHPWGSKKTNDFMKNYLMLSFLLSVLPTSFYLTSYASCGPFKGSPPLSAFSRDFLESGGPVADAVAMVRACCCCFVHWSWCFWCS